MKRSEMVADINDVFKELFPCENYEDIADAILLLVENRGMLPPRIDFMIGDKKMSDNAWESEDG